MTMRRRRASDSVKCAMVRRLDMGRLTRSLILAHHIHKPLLERLAARLYSVNVDTPLDEPAHDLGNEIRRRDVHANHVGAGPRYTAAEPRQSVEDAGFNRSYPHFQDR